MAQKFCECEGDTKPGCCPGGWQTVQVGSRFCSPAESRYHPIEGEACTSAWALEKCRIFVLGHPNLILAVDHKLLLSIFSPEQDLSEILMSRRSDSPIASIPKSKATPPVVNNVLPAYSEIMGPPNWVNPPS